LHVLVDKSVLSVVSAVRIQLFTPIFLFLVSHFNFLFVPCGGLSWLLVSFLLHVK